MGSRFKRVQDCSWVSQDKSHVGRYKDAEGNGLSGFYYRDFRFTRRAVALNNGYYLKKYSYPLLPDGILPFKSDMHNWNNLHYLGEWNVKAPDGKEYNTSERLIDAVYYGTKPMGFTEVHKYDLDKVLEIINDYDLECSISKVDFSSDYTEVGVCIKGKVSKTFDLNALARSYGILSETTFFDAINIFNSNGASSYVNNEARKSFKTLMEDSSWRKPKTYGEYILQGLLLGHPVEATFSMLAQLEKNNREIIDVHKDII